MRWIWLACCACGANAPRPQVPALVHAIDTNPDPTIVEVTLVASEATVEYTPGVATPVLAYRDGANPGAPATVPGPLIEANVGDRLIVHFRNELSSRATTVHWHGLRLPIEMDGDPMVVDPVKPGGTYDYDIVLRDAGLHWYHPHVATDEQIELGLQGPLLVRGPDEPKVAVERVFVLDDVDLASDGSVRLDPDHLDLALGRHGDTLLVNGAAPGSIEVAPGSVERWRIVNTSNGRFFQLALGRSFRVIGWDGGLVPEPYDTDELLVGPGERYDVVVTLGAETPALVARDVPRAHGGVDRGGELVEIRLAGSPAVAATLPSSGPAFAALPVTAQTTRRRFVLDNELDGLAGAVFFVNDQRWPMNTPVGVQLGDVEVLEVVNDSDCEHPVHLHGHYVQILDRDGVAETRRGWKDTVVLGPTSTVHLAVQYGERGKWMFHCQIPEHAERGMTADLDVR